MITLQNSEVILELNPYGASIVTLQTKDKNGKFRNIQLSHKDESVYETSNVTYFGATCGRFAGRITNAEFTIDGEKYELSKNYNDDHTLHGGVDNFTVKKWDSEVREEGDKKICKFTIKSADLDQGFPGNVEVSCEYVLEGNTLTLNYYGTSDKKTYLNLTNHGYFNLSDEDTIYGHDLQLDCSKYCVTDSDVIYKNLASVEGTEFDFRKSQKLEGLFDKKDPILKELKGYDSCFILDKSSMGHDLYLKDEKSGRSLRCTSTYPAVVMYTYNFPKEVEMLDRKNIEHAGVAIEFQYAPNAMNVEELDIPVIDKARPFKESIKFEFNV